MSLLTPCHDGNEFKPSSQQYSKPHVVDHIVAWHAANGTQTALDELKLKCHARPLVPCSLYAFVVDVSLWFKLQSCDS